MNDQREHTIRNVPLSQCTLEVLQREKEESRRTHETIPMSMAQKARRMAIEAEIRRRG